MEFQMATTIIGIIFLIAIIVVAGRLYLINNQSDDDNELLQETIHTSGIYSIVRKSPHDAVTKVKPDQKNIEQYLKKVTEDIHKNPLTKSDKKKLIEMWNDNLLENIKEIEQGDLHTIEYYHVMVNDQLCSQSIKNKTIIGRTDIFDTPELVPPYFLGCTCQLKAHNSTPNFDDTEENDVFASNSEININKLPQWKNVIKID